MKRLLLTGPAVLSLLFLATGSTLASTINFSSFSQPGNNFNNLGTSVTQSGFTFSSASGPFGDGGLGVWQDSSSNHPPGGSASTSLLEFTGLTTTTMTASGNGAFDLNSIELAEWGASQGGGVGSFSVTFTGTRADNSTVSQSFTVLNNVGSPQLQNFNFSGFSNVVKVQFTQGIFSSGTAYQFDDIGVNGSNSPVPEPSSFLMLGTALISGIGAMRRKFPK